MENQSLSVSAGPSAMESAEGSFGQHPLEGVAMTSSSSAASFPPPPLSLGGASPQDGGGGLTSLYTIFPGAYIRDPRLDSQFEILNPFVIEAPSQAEVNAVIAKLPTTEELDQLENTDIDISADRSAALLVLQSIRRSQGAAFYNLTNIASTQTEDIILTSLTRLTYSSLLTPGFSFDPAAMYDVNIGHCNNMITDFGTLKGFFEEIHFPPPTNIGGHVYPVLRTRIRGRIDAMVANLEQAVALLENLKNPETGPEPTPVLPADFSGPVDILNGTFAFNSIEDEQLLWMAGETGAPVPVVAGSLFSGTIQMRVDNEGNFHSVDSETPASIALNPDAIPGFIEGTNPFGIQIQVVNNEIVGDMTVLGQPVSQFTDFAGLFLNNLSIPGLSETAGESELLGLGSVFANTRMEAGFSDGILRFGIYGLTIQTGDSIMGTMDFIWENGVFTGTGEVLAQITNNVQGLVSLTYNSDTGFSGSGSVSFQLGMVSGSIAVSYNKDGNPGWLAEGTGSISTDSFQGTAKVFYGPKATLYNTFIRDYLSNMGSESDLNLEQDLSSDGIENDWILAGYVQGTVPITDSVAAEAEGMILEDGRMAIEVGLENTQTINLTDGAQIDPLAWNMEFPIASSGLAGMFATLGFSFEAGIDPITIPNASLRGTLIYWPSQGPNFSGSVGAMGTASMGGNVRVGGNAGILGRVDVGVGKGEISLNAGMALDIPVNVDAEADMRVDFGPNGIEPHLSAKALLHSEAALELTGKIVADFKTRPNFSILSSHHEWTAVSSAVLGTFDLEVAYQPEEADKFYVGPPQGEESDGKIFKSNLTKETLEALIGGFQTSSTNEREGVPNPNGSSQEQPEASDGENPDWDGPTDDAFEDTIFPAVADQVKVGYINLDGELHELIVEDVNENGDDSLRIMRYSKNPTLLLTRVDILIARIDARLQAPGISQQEQGELNARRVNLVTVRGKLSSNPSGDTVAKSWLEQLIATGLRPTTSGIKRQRSDEESAEEAKAIALQAVLDIKNEVKDLDGELENIPTDPIHSPATQDPPDAVSLSKLHYSQDFRWEGQESTSGSSGKTEEAMVWLQNQKIGGYVRFHIIHALLGGKGENANLIATPIAVNNAYKDNFEVRLIKKLEEGEVIWLRTEYIRYHSAPADPTQNDKAEYFPKEYKAVGGTMEWNSATNDWDEKPSEFQYTANQTDLPLPTRASIDNATWNCNDLASYSTAALRQFPYQINTDAKNLKRPLDNITGWQYNNNDLAAVVSHVGDLSDLTKLTKESFETAGLLPDSLSSSDKGLLKTLMYYVFKNHPDNATDGEKERFAKSAKKKLQKWLPLVQGNKITFT